MKKIFFNPEDYDANTCMSFKNREECVEFSQYLDSIGKRWKSNDRYTESINFNKYLSTVYYFNEGLYGDGYEAKKRGDTILDYDQFYYSSDEEPECDVALTFDQLFS